MHKLYITGGASDVVELVQPDANWVPADHLSQRQVNGQSYNVYQLDSRDELLIHNAITNINIL